MKRILKQILCLSFALVCVFSFTACKKISETTTDMTKTIYGTQNTNGGVTLVYDGYLYFINGTKDNDGTSATKNVRSAICKVKLNDDGTVDDETYEVVIDNLVGFDKGSIAIFGNFLYFTTPNDEVNYESEKLNNQTKFMRYDLVNKKSYTLYTSAKNSSDEKISYAYYVVGNELDLVVYESSNKTITSLKIGKKVVTNYVISDVNGCILSENYGKCVTEDAVVDANSYVFYTKSVDVYSDGNTDGNKVYKITPNVTSQDKSVCIFDGGKTVSLLSIRNGKLLYSSKSENLNEDIIYFQKITSSSTEKLQISSNSQIAERISYTTYDNIIFVEETDGSIYAVCLNDTNTVALLDVNDDNKLQIDLTNINNLGDSEDISFVDLVTIEEKENEESEETDEVTYLIYIDSSIVYKLEIMRNGEVSTKANPIKLSKSTVSESSGTLIPEVIGTNLYIFAKEYDSENKEEKDTIYLHVIDLTISENSTDYAKIVAKTE